MSMMFSHIIDDMSWQATVIGRLDRPQEAVLEKITQTGIMPPAANNVGFAATRRLPPLPRFDSLMRERQVLHIHLNIRYAVPF